MKVLFVHSSNSMDFEISPFIKSQAESLREKEVEIDFFKVKIKRFKGVLKNIRELRKALKNKKYDIVHAHFVYNGIICLLTFKKIHLVISFLGSDILGIKGADDYKKYTSILGTMLSKLVAVFANKVIVKTNQMASKLKFLSTEKLHVIPNGVDFEIFKPMDKSLVIKMLNIDSCSKIVLFLGNPADKNKNFKLVQDSISLLSKEKSIILLAPYPVNKDIIPLYLNASDVLVLSSYTEGSANVIKEAMACNLPIVSTNVGDVRDNIKDVVNCYISDFDPKSFSNCILKAITYNSRTNGREAIRHLSSKIIADKIINVYKSTLFSN